MFLTQNTVNLQSHCRTKLYKHLPDCKSVKQKNELEVETVHAPAATCNLLHPPDCKSVKQKNELEVETVHTRAATCNFVAPTGLQVGQTEKKRTRGRNKFRLLRQPAIFCTYLGGDARQHASAVHSSTCGQESGDFHQDAKDGVVLEML